MATFVGTIPKGASLWGIKRETSTGQWERLARPSLSGEVDEEFWPLSRLSVKTIRESWGGGRFEIWWFGAGRKGARTPLGRSRPILVRSLPDSKKGGRSAVREAVQQPPVAMSESPNIDADLDRFQRFRTLVKQESAQDLEMANRSWMLMLDQQQKLFQLQTERLLSPQPNGDESASAELVAIRRTISGLAERLDDEEDDGDARPHAGPALSERLQNGIALVLEQITPHLGQLVEMLISPKQNLKP